MRGSLGLDKDTTPVAADATWRERWAALTDMGIAAFCVPESSGGFGFRIDVAVAAATELGRALHGAPFAGISAAAHALAHNEETAELLRRILNGEAVCAFGQLGPDGRTAGAVDGAASADALLLVDPFKDGLILFTNPDSWRADDSRHRFDVTRSCSDIVVVPSDGQLLPHTGRSTEIYALLLCADAIGGVQQMLERTVAYSSQRTTFGTPIGGFQSVQHRLVDHTVRARGMALSVAEAARLLAAESPDASHAIAMAELSVSSSATHILHDLLQLTGAIGFTWEYGLHLYERRVHQDARLRSNPRAAARAIAEIEGWQHVG